MKKAVRLVAVVACSLVASCGRFYGHECRVNGTVSPAVVDADRADRGFVATFNSTDDQTGLTGLAETLQWRSGSSQ